MESPLSSSGSNRSQLSISTFKLWYWMILEYIGISSEFEVPILGVLRLSIWQVNSQSIAVPSSWWRSAKPVTPILTCWVCLTTGVAIILKGKRVMPTHIHWHHQLDDPSHCGFPSKGIPQPAAKQGRIGASAKEPICGHGSFYLFGYTSHITFDLNRSGIVDYTVKYVYVAIF